MIRYPDENIRAALYAIDEPLAGIKETHHEWWLGTLSLNKQHPEFRSGYSHPLRPGARFLKQFFDLGTKRGFAAIFCASDGPQSSPGQGLWFAGWVPPEREAEFDTWLAFLNNEIAQRLAANPTT